MPHSSPDSISRRKRQLILAAGMATLITGLLLLLPLAIEHQAKRWIEENGNTAVIENIDFNPFSAKLNLYNLTIKRDDATVFALPELQLKLSWLALFKQQLSITGLDIHRAVIHIEQDNGVTTIGGITLPPGTQATEEPVAWAFLLEQLTLQETTLHYRHNRHRSTLAIDRFELKQLSSVNPEQPAAIRLKGTLDGAIVELDGSIAPFADPIKLQGDLSVEPIQLNHYSSLLDSLLAQAEGTLTLRSQLDATWSADGHYQFSQQGLIGLSHLLLGDQAHLMKSEQLTWKGGVQLSGNAATGQSQIDISGQLKLDAGSLQLPEESEVELADASWSGDIHLDLGLAQHQLTTTGVLALQELNLRQAQNNGTIEGLKLEPKKADLRWNSGLLQLNFPAVIALNGITLDTPALELQQQQLNWQGQLELTRQEGQQLAASNGRFDAEKMTLKIKQSEANVQLDQISWEGALSLDPAAANPIQEGRGKLALQGLRGKKEGMPTDLITIDRLETQNITVADSQLNIEQMGILGLTMAEASAETTGQPLLSLEQIKLAKIEFTADNGLVIRSITPQNLQQQLIHYPDRSWNIHRFISSMQSLMPTQDTAATKAETTDGPEIRIDNITLLGESQLQFTDLSTTPAYNITLQPRVFELKQVNSRTPEVPALLLLDSKVDSSASLQVEAELTPFSSPPSIQLEGSIEGLGLPPLTSYTSSLLGYQLESGELSAELQIKSEQGQLQGNNKLTLRQVEVSQLNGSDSAKTTEPQSIPLEKALSMLRDKNNTIRINLPVGGDLNNPTFDLRDTINQALGSALKDGVRTYLATALFPFGTLVTLIEIAGDEAAKIRLDPIEFTPGSSTLEMNHHAYLDKLALLIDERPEVHIRLCGIAAATDRAALAKSQEKPKEKNQEKNKQSIISDDQLLELAQARADSVERYLMEQRGVDARRLIDCRPKQLSDEEEDLPRVELLI